MGSTKKLLLFIALLLPIFIFVFLRFFGKNEFDVPLLHENGVTEKPADCAINYPTPYTLADSIFTRLNGKNTAFLIVNFGMAYPMLYEIQKTLGESSVTVIESKNIEFKNAEFLKRCILLMKPAESIVLIDDKKRIRGYYDGSDRDELDRLEAEIKIIAKKY